MLLIYDRYFVKMLKLTVDKNVGVMGKFVI